ncbi:MAG TPA: hypothetical protein VLA67_04735, partial [Nitrospiraceae bacterium]|nr:hypothetical protein [Nitrospiraceae bacterium]
EHQRKKAFRISRQMANKRYTIPIPTPISKLEMNVCGDITNMLHGTCHLAPINWVHSTASTFR